MVHLGMQVDNKLIDEHQMSASGDVYILPFSGDYVVGNAMICALCKADNF